MSNSNKKGQNKHNDGPSFSELLKKQCPWHPHSKHSAIDFYSLCRVMQDLPEPPPPNNSNSNNNNSKDKGKGKMDEAEDDEDKFQTTSKTVNVIFGGIPGTASKRSNKLVLREIMAIEPAAPTPLKWFEVPITFSRKDQWTSFSELGRFPLVLDPIVVGSRLTKVLIDGDSGLNIIFAKTLRKMCLDIIEMLTPMDSPFYRIVLCNAAIPVGQVILPVTFSTKEHYRTEYIWFEVADFETSYHAILGKPALAKFMAIPHYVYLLLKMPGPKGELSLHGDLRRSYKCDIEAVEIVATTQIANPIQQVFAASKKLTPTKLKIPENKSGANKVKSAIDKDFKAIALETSNPSKTALIGIGLDSK